MTTFSTLAVVPTKVVIRFPDIFHAGQIPQPEIVAKGLSKLLA